MDAWEGWPFARLYMLLVALAFVVIGLQVLLFHWRAAFRRLTMYGPVLLAPVLVVAGVVGAIKRDGVLGWIVLAVFAVGIVDGLIGVAEHLRGIAGRIGGFLAAQPDERAAAASAAGLHGARPDRRARARVGGAVKARGQLGARELQVIEERRRSGYRREALEHFAAFESELRAVIARLLPGVPDTIDLAGFVDEQAENPIGRGDRSPGLPPVPELFRLGLGALRDFGFARLPAEEQDRPIARIRRGQADEELGLPAKEFVDRLLVKALAGYLAHPETWERIGFNGPAYPNGYAWITPTAAARRHEGFPGAARL